MYCISCSQVLGCCNVNCFSRLDFFKLIFVYCQFLGFKANFRIFERQTHCYNRFFLLYEQDWGYFSNTGQIYNSGKCTEYGQQWQSPDLITCIVDQHKNTLSYLVNGHSQVCCLWLPFLPSCMNRANQIYYKQVTTWALQDFRVSPTWHVYKVKNSSLWKYSQLWDKKYVIGHTLHIFINFSLIRTLNRLGNCVKSHYSF